MKFNDLTGRTFGYWKVLERDDNDKATVMYRCLCTKCNREYVVRGTKLTSGESTMCSDCAHKTKDSSCPVQKNNESDTTGVRWNKKDKRWEAYISVNHHKYYLGQYVDKEEAVQARLKAEREFLA